jgi:xanthine dehydrogenase accessory factor
MMFVGEDQVLGSIGGGEPEHLAIRHAKESRAITTRQYVLNNRGANGLDMICGGTIHVMFIPV